MAAGSFEFGNRTADEDAFANACEIIRDARRVEGVDLDRAAPIESGTRQTSGRIGRLFQQISGNRPDRKIKAVRVGLVKKHLRPGGEVNFTIAKKFRWRSSEFTSAREIRRAGFSKLIFVKVLFAGAVPKFIGRHAVFTRT